MGFFQNTFNNVKSNYQKNVQQPATQTSKPKTTRDVLNQINLLRQTDKASADEYTKKLFTSMQDPSSRFYNPYNQATNKAVTNLQNLGFDMGSIDDDWYNRNSWLKDYYVQTANTNGLSSTMTNKRASKEQKAAYNYNQLWQAEENTKKAENEWNELQKELSYWANRTDRNYSDDEIIGKIDWDKYKTLRKMDDTRLAGTPMELNRGIGYSEDAMYGVLWAARNGGSTGNLWLDMANSADGTGYKYNPEIASKLDPNSENFNPYSVGSTNIDDAALYFGVSGFNKEWVESHKDLAFSTDETEKKMYDQVRSAYDNQLKAEEEAEALYDFVSNKLKYLSDPEKILGRIDWKKYPTLAAMDKSIGQNGNLATGDLIALTEGLNYRYDDLKAQIEEACAKKNAQGNGLTFAAKIGQATGALSAYVPSEQQEVVNAQDKKIAESAELMHNIATPKEQAVFENAGSSTYPEVKNAWGRVFEQGLDTANALTKETVRSSIGNLSSALLKDADVVQNYNMFKGELEEKQKTLDDIYAEIGDLVHYGKEIEENPVVKVTINGKTYDLALNWDGTATMGDYNEETGERDYTGSYVPAGLFDRGTNEAASGEYTREQYDEAVSAAIEKANKDRSAIESVRDAEVTEEQQDKIYTYRDAENYLNNAEDYMLENEEVYNNAVAQAQVTQAMYQMTIDMLKVAGVDTTEMEKAAQVSDFLLNFAQYSPTEWKEYNLYHEYSKVLYSGEANIDEVYSVAKSADDEIQKNIELAQWLFEYADENGIQMPDSVKENLLRWGEKLERQHYDFENLSLLKNADFKEGVKAGQDMVNAIHSIYEDEISSFDDITKNPIWDKLTDEQKDTLKRVAEERDLSDAVLLLRDYAGYIAEIEERTIGTFPFEYRVGDLLTDYEKDTYYYLLSTQGVGAAQQYYDSLIDDSYGVLHTRAAKKTKGSADDLAGSGFWGRRGADVLSMLLSPVAAVNDLFYMAGNEIQRLAGARVEINPNNVSLSANIYKKEARQKIQEEINRVHKNPVVRNLLSGLQEIISNRGDSFVNMVAFAPLFGGIANGMLQEFMSAMPMAFSAATDAVADAKEKGASDTQLLGVFASTLLAEAGTEAISIENMKDAFKLGSGEITGAGLKSFLKNWLTKSGVSEMVGESINDIIENTADEAFLGDKSEFAQLVKKYETEDHMTREDAELAARRDQMMGVLHTALISYLSPGMDIGTYSVGRFLYYRDEAKNAQQNQEKDYSIFDIMKRDKRYREAYEKYQGSLRTQAEIEEIERNNSPRETEASDQEAGIAVPEIHQMATSPEQKSTDVFTLDYEILETAKDADASSQTASISKVLDVNGTEESGDMADAAAINMTGLFGEGKSSAEGVQELVVGSYAAGVDVAQVKQAVQTAALSQDSAAHQTIQSEEYQKANPAQKAEMLAATVEQDANNAIVQDQVSNAIHENRVAMAEKEVINNPEVEKKHNKTYEAQGTLLAKQQATETVQKNLDAVHRNKMEKQKTVMSIGSEYFKDVRNHSLEDQFNSAMKELERADKVEQEYKQSLQNAQKAEQEAQEAVDRAIEDEANTKRQLAEQMVAEQDQQRVEANAQAQVEAAQQAEQEEKQRVQQEATDNANIADAEGFLEAARKANPGMTVEDEQKIRDRFAAIQKQRSQQTPVEDERDADGKLTDRAKEARNKALEFVNRKFGIPVVLADDITKEDAKGIYSEGFYDPDNHRIVLNNDLSFDEVMTRILPHELLHSLEQAGSYNSVVNSLLGIYYGQDSDITRAVDNLKKNNGVPTTRLEADIIYYKSEYEKGLKDQLKGKRLSYLYAAQELSAHRMGEMFYNPDNPQRSQEMIERLAAEKPNVAKQIMNSLKSMVKKALGMKGAWMTNTQKTIDLFEKALGSSQNGKQVFSTDNKKYSLESIYDAPDDMQGSFDRVKDPNYLLNGEEYYFYNENLANKAFLNGKYATRSSGGYVVDMGPLAVYSDENGVVDHVLDVRGQSVKTASDMKDEAFELAEGGLSFEDQRDIIDGMSDKDGSAFRPVGFDEASQRNNRRRTLEYSEQNSERNRTELPAERREEVSPSETSQSGIWDDLKDDPMFSDLFNKKNKYSLPENNTIVKDNEGDPLATELPGGTVVLDTDNKYSLASFTPEEQQRVRQALLDRKRPNGKPEFTEEEVDKYMEDALGIAGMIAADRTRLDFAASDNQVFLKPNNDYYFTLDASTLCAKRLLYQGTFDYVQHALPDEVFTPEDLIDLVNIMNEMGYETPCGICYVESRRRWLDTYAQKFLDSLPEEGRPSIDDLTTSDGLEKLRHNNPDMYKAFVDAMNKKGTANPKVVQLRTEYRGDIGKLTKKDIQKVKDIGGLRIQSFSDFETPHLLDMVQAVMDMASVGLTSQAYTKVPNFAWVFGDTGIKINLSLIGKGTGLDEKGNLVFDNREGIDFDEAMKLRERYNKNVGTILVGINDDHIIAAMGDPRIDFIIPFHKSGWSQEELRKMPTLNNYNDYTNSQNELMIVGKKKHKVKEVKNLGMKALDNWIVREGDDHPGYKVIDQGNGKYTVTYDIGYETESFKTHAERTGEKLSNFEPVGANQYWDFKKSGEWNARKYLKMCAKSGRIPKFSQFLVDNGNGTFSLPEGTDKRSTAIREGYWKTLIDFKMYENDGYGRTKEDGTKTDVKGSAQREVTPDINMNEAHRVLNEYKLGRQMPDKANGQKGAFIPMQSNNDVPVAIPAAEEYIDLIKRKREGKKPVNPNDDLQASPSIDVGSLGESYFHQGPSDEANLNARTTFGATESPAVLGNTENAQEEVQPTQQNTLAVDAETGETVRSKYSLPSDAPYLSAVDHGDMETAQRMVDEKAEENGYVKAGYHGTLSGGFTIFDKAKAGIGGNSGAGFYFSSNDADSDANYSDVEGADNWFKANHLADRILEEFRNSDEEDFEYEGYEITEGMPYNEVVEIAKKILTKNPQTYHVYLDPGKTYIRDFKNSTNLIEDVINNFDESMYNPDDYDSEDEYYDELSMARSDEIYQAISDAVYNGIADVDSNYEIFANVNYEDIINKLTEIAMDYESLTWDDLIKVLSDQYIDIGTDDMDETADGSHEIARAIVEAFGYDSIEDREVSKKFNQLKNMGNAGDTIHYIMFKPDQIKLADPVTYDNEGNIIPPSERFRHANNDIRYSLPSDDILDQQINEYLNNGGVLGQQTTSANPNISYRQWGNEGAQRSDGLDQQAKDYVLNSPYLKDTNAAEMARALEWIRSNKQFADDDGFQESIRKVTAKNFNYRTKDGQAKMVAVMALAVARKDTAAQVQLADAYNQQGTDLGQALQARKLFRMMTPQGRVATLQKMLGNVQNELESKGIRKEIKLSDWIYQAAAEATEEGQFNKIRQAAAIELADQIPANWKDKLRGLRMLSMLGNPRTHVRNFIGNALFVPAVSLKNKMGAALEVLTKQEERTKTLSLTVSPEIRSFVSQDAEFMKDDLTGEYKYNEGNLVQKEQKPFKGFLQAMMDFNSAALEKEDWFFLKGHYRRALGGWIQANGYTIDQLKNDPALLDKGRAYAINEAQKATYRDFNGVADKLNKLTRNPETTGQKVLGFAVDAVLPFKKTPANILKRGIEYSPAGFVRGLKNAMVDVRSGKITAAQAIDRICSGLAGTAVLAMGAFLARAGIVTCGLGDDDDKLEKEQGNQKYAIKLKLFGEDVTYTMDWAAPMSMPFFVGAALVNQIDQKGEMDINGIMNAMGNIAEPVFNLSMLDGVNTLFKTAQSGETDALTQIGGKIASNYITSYVPSVLGAITRTFFDDKRRATYVQSGHTKGMEGTINYALEQTENKLPGLSQSNIPVRDVFGNVESDSFVERLFENFISPGYISHYKNDPVLKEMDRLYGANVTDSEDMVPKDPAKTLKYKGEQIALTAEQWDQYKAVRGQTAYEMLTNLINSQDYKDADATDQIQMIKQAWSYADDAGKKAILPDYEMEDYGESPVQTITTDGKIAAYNAKMMTALASGDYEGYETMIEGLRQLGVEDSTIKTKIGNKYRDQYKEAYRKNDYEKMAEIEEILNMTDFDFDLEAWEDQVDKKYGR